MTADATETPRQTPRMKCSILGCEAAARGQVDVQRDQWKEVVVPAHLCKFCPEHPCQLEIACARLRQGLFA